MYQKKIIFHITKGLFVILYTGLVVLCAGEINEKDEKNSSNVVEKIY